MKTLLLVLAIGFAGTFSFGGQGSIHSDRCRGIVRPFLGIVGTTVCTKEGWRWQPR